MPDLGWVGRDNDRRIEEVRTHVSGIDKLLRQYGFYLLRHASGQMHVNMIISEPAVKIIKRNVNIAV